MTKRSLDDEELVYVVARGFLKHYITRDWSRKHEKAAITNARNTINRINAYLRDDK